MKSIWYKTNEDAKKKMFAFADEYKDFISKGKTEREAVDVSVALVEKAGFKNLASVEKLSPGDKVYAVNMNKDIVAFVIGKKHLTEGLNIVGAHIDSPRLDLKQNPLYEDHELALLDTHYYGGVKKYQWVATPMALHGVVCKTDGSKVNIVIGEEDSDPVVGISDLLIHLSSDQMKKTGATVVEGEDLNVLVGSIPDTAEEKDAVKKAVLDLLKDKYGIEERDFISAEIEVVPAGKARDYGLDRSLIMGYGHDDRVCAFTSLKAVMDVKDPERTTCAILVDKEEVGSVGATGMHSAFFANTIMELLDKSDRYCEMRLRRTLANSKMLSSDVAAGFDPNYPAVNELKNTAFMGYGLVLTKFTGRGGKGGASDANPEFIAEVRKALDDNEVQFQTAEIGKVDQGGGGTIAYICANFNMQVLDAGIAVQNMHAPWEVVSKADVYEAYLGYKAFLKDIK